jgi:hypothetical protein
MDYLSDIDPKLLGDPGASRELVALVYTPRRQRRRFPENCVELVDSIEEACRRAEGSAGHHPALVVGPFRSSEGFRLYYLIRWLDQTAR